MTTDIKELIDKPNLTVEEKDKLIAHFVNDMKVKNPNITIKIKKKDTEEEIKRKKEIYRENRRCKICGFSTKTNKHSCEYHLNRPYKITDCKNKGYNFYRARCRDREGKKHVICRGYQNRGKEEAYAKVVKRMLELGARVSEDSDNPLKERKKERKESKNERNNIVLTTK